MSDADWQDSRKKPHSGLGLASCIIAALSGLVMLITVGVAGYVSSDAEMDSDESITIAIGLVLMAAAGVSVLGGAIGIGALFQTDRKPMLGILGITFNGLIIAGLIGLIVIGTMME